MAVFGYSFLPPSDNGLPSPSSSHSKHERSSKASAIFGRARARYVAIVAAVITFFLIIILLSSPAPDNTRIQTAAQRLGFRNSFWCSILGKQPGVDYQPVTQSNQWLKGSGRAELSFNTPFNSDDLTMTEDECDAFFPALYKDIDRSVEYFTNRQE